MKAVPKKKKKYYFYGDSFSKLNNLNPTPTSSNPLVNLEF